MSKAPLSSGSRLDAITVVELLSADEFVFTYRARDDETRDTVIVQEFFPSVRCERASDGVTVVAAGDMTGEAFESGLDGFLQQARLLAQLEDPHIRQVSHYAEANGTAYLLMPDEDGEPLAAILERHHDRQLSEQGLQAVKTAILKALITLDQSSIVHGDISPATIFVRRDGPAMLTDFGVARHDFYESCDLLSRSLRPGYAPVELYGARHDQGVWTDVYSLGATLYRCATGLTPSPAGERIAAIGRGEPDPLIPAVQAGAGKYSEGFLSDIDTMLIPAPDARPQNPGSLLGSLPKSSVASARTAVRDVASTATAEPGSITGWRIAVAAALVLAAGLGYLWWDQRDGAATGTPVALTTEADAPVVPETPAPVDAADPDEPAVISKQDDAKRIDLYRELHEAEARKEREKEIERRIAERVRARVAQERAERRSSEQREADALAKELDALVTKGNRALDAGRIAAPTQANALYFFREALYLDRRNAKARGGLDRALDVLSDRVDEALDNNDSTTARVWIELIAMQRGETSRLNNQRSRALSIEDEVRADLSDEITATLEVRQAELDARVKVLTDSIAAAITEDRLVDARADLARLSTLAPGHGAISPALGAIANLQARVDRDAELSQQAEEAAREIETLETRTEELESTIAELENQDAGLSQQTADATGAQDDGAAAERIRLLAEELTRMRTDHARELVVLNDQLDAAREREIALQAAVDSDAGDTSSTASDAVEALTQSLATSRSRVQSLEAEVARLRSDAAVASAPAADPAPASPGQSLPASDEVLLDGVAAYYAGNYDEAFSALMPIARAGDPRAQFRIAVMYSSGRGVPESQTDSSRWLNEAAPAIRESARRGLAWAEADLGSMYERGWLVNQSYEAAAQWYTRAVEKGYAPAQNNLGVLHEQGLGVPQNRTIAINLLRLAAAQGDAIARENLNTLTGQ